VQARQGRSPAERAGVTDRAAHRARLFIDGEVVHREPTGHRCLQWLGFDRRVVSGVVDRATQIACAISGIAGSGLV